MPRGKPQRRMYPNPPQLQPLGPSVRQQCCVVCYKNFTPFDFNSEVWDSNMIKNFYTSLNISLGSTGDGEEDEEVLSLPFCPQCHTKVSVMSAYQIELQNINSKCNSMRNDLAFTVVETMGQNSRAGPIDYIRQQIYDKWKLTYDENQAKSSPETKVGLEYIACDPSAVPHNCGNFICVCQAGGGIGMGGKGVAEMVGNNRPANGFEYDALDFVETGMSNTNSNTNRNLSVPHWKGAVIPKLNRPPQMVDNERAPPLLSPHKPPYTSQGGFDRKVGARGASIPMMQNRGKLSVPAKAHAQRLNVGPRKSSLTPNNVGIRRKVDYSHVKPRVPSRFIETMKRNSKFESNLMKPNEDGDDVVAGMEARQTMGPTEGGEGVRGKRKLSETELEGEGPAKMLRHSMSPQKIPAELVEAVIGSPRSTRNSPRSPVKGFVDEHETFPATRYTGTEGIFPCTYCSKEYTLKSRLLRHESDMHPECKLYQCDLDDCGKGFSSREAFKRHVLNAHKIPASEIEMHKCPIPDCQKAFLQLTTLERHVQEVHHGKMRSPQEVEAGEEEAEPVKVVGDIITPKVAEKDKVDEEEMGTDAQDLKPPNDPVEMSTVGSERPSFKVKKKVNINRPFGIRRRKRGPGPGKKKPKETEVEDEEGSSPVKRRQRRQLPTAMEPVRKSSRQRGVQLDAGKPMYPPLEPKSKQAPSGSEGGKSEDEQEGSDETADSKTNIPSPGREHLDEEILVDAGPKTLKPIKGDETAEKIEAALDESVILGGENANLKLTSNPKSTEARMVTSTPMRKPGASSSFEGDESTLMEEETEGEKEVLNTTYTVEGSEAEIKVPET